MQVRLVRNWTGPDGVEHHAGDLIEVDPATLAELEESGHVGPDSWIGPGSPDDGSGKPATVQPTSWIGPGGADRG